MLLKKGIDVLERLVALDDSLEQIVPSAINGSVAGSPLVSKEVLPKTTVIPVGTASGHDCLVGGKGVQVINTTSCTLQALTIDVSSHHRVERNHSVTIELALGAVGLIVGDAVGGVLLKELVACRASDQQ